MAKQKEKTCFIIMPITTPKQFMETYRDGKDHFIHILESLFIPAVESAGFVPIKPIAEGADLIQAEIVKNLDESDLVLCDMSILNPNVFFEYGIRTALNKPVCIVKDQFTTKIPFDTSIINYFEYDANIEVWNVDDQKESLKTHIVNSEKRSKGINNLWKYFGIEKGAVRDKTELNTSDKLDILLSKVDKLANPKTENYSKMIRTKWPNTIVTKRDVEKTLSLKTPELFDNIEKIQIDEDSKKINIQIKQGSLGILQHVDILLKIKNIFPGYETDILSDYIN
ncbi:MAG: hypothetical protein K8R74_03400 [Bacteroidales bacterium]|nr:hypothetical protein [Bacteroidales bacterium]